MAQEWTMEAARALLHQWNRRKVEGAVRVGGLSVDLDAVEAWLLDQKPASLAEAERLLDRWPGGPESHRVLTKSHRLLTQGKAFNG